jgi:protoporphyrinogen oxidase
MLSFISNTPRNENGGQMSGGPIIILGGGPAGLAVGYYAKKKGLPFTIYEAQARTGGNCITHKNGDFGVDSGAHRFHDMDAQVTRDIKNLVGENL